MQIIWVALNPMRSMKCAHFLDILIRVKSDGSVEHELYQKPTNSGQYLHYSSHCPMRTKTNIVTSETRRILRSCSTIQLAWKHLENLRKNLLTSGYPQNETSLLITKTVSQHNNPSRKINRRKDAQDFILRVPYINEATSRIMKKIADNSGLNIRLVTTPGSSVESLIREKPKHDACQCTIHQNNINCKQQYIVYRATCQLCGEQYIGGSARPSSERIKEHEASVRLQNTRTTLGEHLLSKHATNLPDTVRKGHRDYNNFFQLYDFKIQRRIGHCKT